MSKITQLLYTFFLIFALFACSDDTSQVPLPDMSQAQPYQAITNKAYPTPADKVGVEVTARTSAQGFEQIAQTAIKIAIERLEGNNADEVVVKLFAEEPSDKVIANLIYAPSGQNTWGDEQPVWQVDVNGKAYKVE